MPSDGKVKKPFYKKVWFLVVVVILLIGVAGASGGSDSDKDSSSDSTSQSTQESEIKEPEVKKERIVSGTAKTLGAGTFMTGSDIKPGLYDAVPGAGESGNFFTSGGANEILGGEYGVPKVRILLKADEEVKISGMTQVKFTPVKVPFVTSHANAKLYTGTFIVGEDIGAGRYKAKPATGESGNFFTSGGTNEILGGEYGVPDVTLNLSDGEEVQISGMDSVTFTTL